MTDRVLTSKHDGVLTLTINNPRKRNAVDPDTMTVIRQAIIAAPDDDEVRVIVLTGAEGHFCAGADIKSALADADEDNFGQYIYDTLTQNYGPTMLAIRDCPMPVIAAVDGYAAGIGCDLALRCDLRLMSENGVLAELFVRVGLIPDGGGTYLLPRLAGLAKAMEIMFTGRNVPAEEAVAIGLANQVLPANNFMPEVQAYAANLAQQSPTALARGKRAMLAALESSFEDALQREADFQLANFDNGDGMEGFGSFLEKRQPQWKGRQDG